MVNFNNSDHKLLLALQEDVSLSQIDLAERSGLSRTSVWRRVRELEEAGVDRYCRRSLTPNARLDA